jgi:hypothetical protein
LAFAAVADVLLEIGPDALDLGKVWKTTSTSLMTGSDAPVSTTSMCSSARKDATATVATESSTMGRRTGRFI